MPSVVQRALGYGVLRVQFQHLRHQRHDVVVMRFLGSVVKVYAADGEAFMLSSLRG
jgi:hypothetical protein